jgi:hypothetical protein
MTRKVLYLFWLVCGGIPKDAPRTLAPRIDAGVGASLSKGEGADVNGEVGVGEGET